MHLSNKQKLFTNFFIHFLKSRSNFKHFEKPKTFCELFSSYLKSRSNFENSQKKDDPHRLCIFDITDFENVLRHLSKNSHFRRPFNKQHGKRSQILSKSVRQHPYPNFSSLWRNLSLRKSLFVICKILGLFFNTLTANDKYSLVNRDILTQPIEVHWSKKLKKLKNLFLHFGNKDQIFESNGDPHSLCISDITDCETPGSSNELKALFQKTLQQATC